jgi:hypothetical protein
VADDGHLFRVNLHLTRRHASADVTAQEDNAGHGKLIIELKDDRAIAVCLPEFLSRQDMSVSVDRMDVPAESKEAAWICTDPLAAGTRIEVTYPLRERTSVESISPGEFTFYWRGPAVVRAEPVQQIRPLFGNATASGSHAGAGERILVQDAFDPL